MNPNTLRTKWAALPGVKFPEQLRAEERAKEATKAPNPAVWMTTSEAAKAAGITCSVLRALCGKRKLTYLRHRGADGVLRNYYRRKSIDKILAARKATDGTAEDGARLNYIPDGYIPYAEAAARLGRARATIDRKLKRKQLRSIYYACAGRRTQRLICAEDVKKATKTSPQ